VPKGKNLELKRRVIAKGSKESHHQRNQRRRTSVSKEGRQPPIYQQLRSLREPQSGFPDPAKRTPFADDCQRVGTPLQPRPALQFVRAWHSGTGPGGCSGQ
jgi:hypothetical protein